MGSNMTPCPFCKEKVKNAFPVVCEYTDGTWGLTHFCEIEEDEVRVAIVISGKTREDVVCRWNRRAKKIDK